MKTLFCLFLFAVSFATQAEVISGKVVGVTDGDTITVLAEGNRQIQVRLADIDAPEKKQPYGAVARQALSDAVFFKDVSVNIVKVDKYGRSVGYVTQNGEDINRRQIRGGYAWVYRDYVARKDYFSDEAAAKQSQAGLWRDQKPQAPWEFRHGKSGESPLMADESGNVVKRSTGNGEEQTRIAEQMYSHVPASGIPGGGSVSSGSSSAWSGAVHTGSRGGRYTITSGGNKSYIPRK